MDLERKKVREEKSSKKIKEKRNENVSKKNLFRDKRKKEHKKKVRFRCLDNSVLYRFALSLEELVVYFQRRTDR